MTYYEDLTPCAYFDDISSDGSGRPWSEFLTAVGWLEPDHVFPTGHSEPAFVDKLIELRNSGEAYMGYHRCGFCPGAPEKTPTSVTYDGKAINVGDGNMFVPGRETVYAAPSLIIHYVVDHDYSPPTEFRDAVNSCPSVHSREYLKRMDFMLEPEEEPSKWYSGILRLLPKTIRSHLT